MSFDHARSRRWRHSVVRTAWVALVGLSGLACRVDNTPPPLRLWTNDLAFQVTSNPVPPPARQDDVYKVVVRDKNTGQAIEGGEGRVYATSRDGINTWDALTPVQPAGTYTAKLNFITSGDWAMGMQFRRDSTRPIEQMDWRQEVATAANEVPIR